MAQRKNNTPGLAKQAPKSGYGLLAVILDRLDAGTANLTRILAEPRRRGGNPGYPIPGLLRLWALQFITKQRYAKRFLESISADQKLLSMCGLKQAPTEATYSRFKSKIAPHSELLDQALSIAVAECTKEIERLRKQGIIPADAPALGELLAFDGTDIQAYANPKRQPPVKSDAAWGYRTPKNKSARAGKEEKEYYYGYKAHAANDAYYGLPLYIEVTPANHSETTRLRKDIDSLLKLHPQLKPRYLMADKGYDAGYNFAHVASLGIFPILAVRMPPKDRKTGKRLYDGIYTKDGLPTCVGGKPMSYLGTDPDGDHYFRCPAEGCHLKDKVDWSRYCDSEHSEKPEGKLLRIIGKVPRFTPQWRALYKQRSSIERYFSSGKMSRLLDQHQYLNLAKVNMHAKMSTLTYLLTSLAHLKADDYAGMRLMNVKLPSSNLPAEATCPDSCPCPQHLRQAA